MAVTQAPSRPSGSALTGDAGTGGPGRARLVGVDAARALAILGMLAVHVGPTDQTGLAGRLYASPHGRASMLFALVAGIGVSLLVDARRGSVASSRTTLVWRAAVLLPAGLALQLLDHGVNVILHGYAVLFLIAALALRLRDAWVLGLAGVATVAGPMGFLAGRISAPEVFDRSAVELGDGAMAVAHNLVLSGPYPAITWSAPLLFGMWLGRRELSSRSTQAWLVVGGTAVALLGVAAAELGQRLLPAANGAPGLEQLVLATPHSQMPLWLVSSTAAAAAVLGLALWLVERVPQLMAPFVAAGQLAFTVYVGHLLVLAAAPDVLRTDDLSRATTTVVVATVLILVLTTAWRSRFRRGPLELLLRPPGSW